MVAILVAVGSMLRLSFVASGWLLPLLSPVSG